MQNFSHIPSTLQTIAEEIILRAMKEFGIEASYRDEKQFWDNAKFPLTKHSKNGVDRGYLLASLEELSQALDESTLKLQSMTASQ